MLRLLANVDLLVEYPCSESDSAKEEDNSEESSQGCYPIVPNNRQSKDNLGTADKDKVEGDSEVIL